MEFQFGRILNYFDSPFTSGDEYLNFTATSTEFQSAFTFWESATITKVALLIRQRIGTQCAHIVELMEPDWSARGIASATRLGATHDARASFTCPNDTTWDGTIQEFTLNESVDVVPGQTVVLKLKTEDTASPDASNYLSVRTNYIYADIIQQPGIYNRGWVRKNTTLSFWAPIAFLLSASKCYGGVGYKSNELTGTTSNYYCNKFTAPAGFDKCLGAVVLTRTTTMGMANDMTLGIFSGGGVTDTTPLATVTTKIGNVSPLDSSSGVNKTGIIRFASPVTITPGNIYRIGTSTTYSADGVPARSTFYSAWKIDAPNGIANQLAYSIKSTGDWTDDTTRICHVYPILQVADSGSGSTIINPNFNQGFN